MDLIVSPEAERELLEAIDWYEARGPGLGADFVRCVDSCFGKIKRHPESYPVVRRGARMAIVRRFPYLVIYRVMEERVLILAVFHASRDPTSWKAR